MRALEPEATNKSLQSLVPHLQALSESRLSHALLIGVVDKVSGMEPHRGHGSIHRWARGSQGRRKSSMGLVPQ